MGGRRESEGGEGKVETKRTFSVEISDRETILDELDTREEGRSLETIFVKIVWVSAGE